ncbi:MAG: hypothetical protein OHK0046_20290 [Anaerolineae bacterium]
MRRMVVLGVLLLALCGRVAASGSGLVISQVYGAGPITHPYDYVELFNAGAQPVSLNGWSVQVALATGSTWTVTALPDVTLQAGQYYLIQQAGGDLDFSLGISKQTAKVALVRSVTPLQGQNPYVDQVDPPIEDLLGFGSAATAYEGTAAAPGLNDNIAAFRRDAGCTDTDNNSADFITGAPAPRDSSTIAPCDGGGPVNTPPTVTSTTPENNATNVPVNANLSVTFSESVTLSGAWFTLNCTISGSVSAAVSGGMQSYTLNPNADFANGETCTVTILAAQVTDTQGAAMTSNVIWSFTTVPPVNTPPTVTSTTPAANATNIALNANLSVSFSESVNVTGTWFTINCTISGSVNAAVSGGMQSYTLNPNADFANGETCTVTILAAQVTDTQGAAMTSNVIWSFTTVPPVNPPPTVTATFPGANATNIAIDVTLSVTFSEEVTAAGTWFTINCDVSGEANALVSGGGQSYTLQPDAIFANGEMCTVTILAAQVTDSQGAPMTADYSWSFITENTMISDDPPQVLSVSPQPDEINVPADTNIAISFSEAVTLSEGAVLLTCPSAGEIALVQSGGPQNFTFNPAADLPEGATCIVSLLASGVFDQDGTPDMLAADDAWSFTVVNLPPTITSVSPADGAEYVAINANLLLVFSELVTAQSGAFNLECNLEAVPLSVTTIETRIILNPLEDLLYGSSCFLRITAALVTDQYGLPLPVDTAIGFTTTLQAVSGLDLPPYVTSATPMDGAQGVSTEEHITITFSEDVALSNAWFMIDCTESGSLSAAISGGPQIFTLTPAVPFYPGETCVVIVLAGEVNDLDLTPQPMAADAVWHFEIDPEDTGNVPPRIISVSPASNAINVPLDAVLTVTFSEDVAVSGEWVTLTCTQSGQNALIVTGGARTFTLTPQLPLVNAEHCVVTVTAAQVVDLDDTPKALAADFTWGFDTALSTATCGQDFTPIYTIQGSGAESPFIGQTIITEGVVTADFEGTLGGFALQSSGDGNPATSDGVFVQNPGVDAVQVGDVLRITATVEEVYGETQLTDPVLILCGEQDAPAPVKVALPLADPEQIEGMWVTFEQTLTVTDTTELGRYGEVVLSSGERLFAPTQITTPGTSAVNQQAANDRNRLLLDDTQHTVYPDPTPYLFGTEPTLRLGDTVNGLTGMMSYAFGAYRLQPSAPPAFVRSNPRPAAPELSAGRLRVASFNMENYFNGPDFPTLRGADTAAELARQQAKLVQAIMGTDADVIGLIEIENDGTGAGNAAQDMVDALNAAGGAVYASVVPPFSMGADAIKAALVYTPATVIPVDDALTNPTPDFDLPRPFVAQTFEEIATGLRFTVVVVHFKSKSCVDSAGENTDQGDGQGCWNALRVQSAELLADWLRTLPNDDILILGDLNAYALEDPITTLQGAGYTNLAPLYLGNRAYSYAFAGQAGTLDYALASPAMLAQVVDMTVWHINTDEPAVLSYNMENKSAAQQALNVGTPYRSSDHDPLVVGLNLIDDDALPTLTWIAPKGQITTGYGNPIYTWSRLIGATEYQLYIAPVATPSVPVFNDIVAESAVCGGATCQFDATTLDESARLTNGAYLVYLRPWEALTPGAWIGAETFTLNAAAPAPATLLALTDTRTSRPVFRWQLEGEAIHATWFQVRLTTQTNQLLLEEWVRRVDTCGDVVSTQCAYITGIDVVNGAYTFSLTSYGPGGISLSPAQQNFTINASIPAIPSGLQVAVDSGRPVLRWADDPNAAWMWLYLGTADGTTIFWEWIPKFGLCDAGVCTFAPDVHPTNSDLLFYALAWGPAGISPAWSDGAATRLDAPLPSLVSNMIVTNPNSGRPTLSWEHATGATWYQVWVGSPAFDTYYVEWLRAMQLGCETLCSLAIPRDLPNGDYLWYVQGWGPGGLSVGGVQGWVQGPAFRVAAAAPGVPVPDSPRETTNKNRPVFAWAYESGVVWYQFKLEGAAGILVDEWYPFEGLGCAMGGVCTLRLPDVSLANGDYTWSLRAYTPAGVSAWSLPQGFTVFR